MGFSLTKTLHWLGDPPWNSPASSMIMPHPSSPMPAQDVVEILDELWALDEGRCAVSARFLAGAEATSGFVGHIPFLSYSYSVLICASASIMFAESLCVFSWFCTYIYIDLLLFLVPYLMYNMYVYTHIYHITPASTKTIKPLKVLTLGVREKVDEDPGWMPMLHLGWTVRAWLHHRKMDGHGPCPMLRFVCVFFCHKIQVLRYLCIYCF